MEGGGEKEKIGERGNGEGREDGKNRRKMSKKTQSLSSLCQSFPKDC